MHQKNTISNLEDHLGYWVRCLSNFVHENFAQKIARYDVSVEQWVVLRTIFGNEPLTLQETASLVGVDNSSLSRMIGRLVKKNLVIRTIDPKNRRSVILTLPAQSKELVPLLSQEADKNDMEFFQGLDESQRAQFLYITKHLLKKNGWNKQTRGSDAMK